MIFTSLQTVMRIGSILSIIGSLSVIITFIWNPLLQHKQVNKIICCVSTCDFFFAIGTLIGRPHDGTWLCWIQSGMTTYFSLVAIFWTTIIAIILYHLVHNSYSIIKNKPFHSWKVHMVCWCLPLILTFAPLSTNSFGNPDADSGWCFLDYSHDRKHSWTLKFWLFTCFYSWIFCASLIYVWLLWSIFLRLSQVYHIISQTRGDNNESDVMAEKIRTNILKLSWYPIIIIVCWIPSAVYDLREAYNSYHDSFSTESDYLNLLPALKGFFTAIAFLTTTYAGGIGVSEIKCEPLRLEESSTGDDEGSDDEGVRESLLYEQFKSEEESFTSSRPSLYHSDSSMDESSSNMLRCSFPSDAAVIRKDSVDSF